MTHLHKIAPAGARATGGSTGTPAASCDLPARPIVPQAPDEASPPVESPTARYMGQSGERATLSRVTKEMVRLYESGLSIRAVAARMGVSRQTVDGRLRRAKVSFRHRQFRNVTACLDDTDRAIMAVIRCLCRSVDPLPNTRELGLLAGIGETTFKNRLTKLVDAGLVQRESRGAFRRLGIDGQWTPLNETPIGRPKDIPVDAVPWPRTGNLPEYMIAAIYAASDTPRYESYGVKPAAKWRARPTAHVPTETVLAGAG